MNKENGKFRIAIVGCGGMGGGHAIAIGGGTGRTIWMGNDVNIEGFDSEATSDISAVMELAGVYDIKPERIRWAEERGFFCYDSYEAMLEDESVDAILIATQNNIHKELAIRAMRAGKNVLCEKPVTMSSDELLEVMEVVKETGKVFYPRQNREWDEDFLIIKKIYDEQLLGDVFDIECRIIGSRGIPGDWRGIKALGGGMMLDWGVHIIDRLLVMVPEKLKTVYCSCTNVTNDEVDDGFKAHLVFESGLKAVLEVGTCHFVKLPLWTMFGNKGSVVIDDWSLSGKMVRLEDWADKDATPILAGEGLTKTMAPRDKNSVIEEPLPSFDFDHNALYMNFYETCLGKAEQIVTNEHALRVLRVMEACMKSNETGETVRFE